MKEPGRNRIDRLYAAIGEAIAPISPPPGLAARLRQRLLAGIPSRPQDGLITVLASAGAWEELAPGISIKILRQDARSRSLLLRMAPSTMLPAHGHDQAEECLVLEGEVTLGDQPLAAGDYQVAPRGTRHGLVRSERGCLLFIRGQRAYRGGA